jgi:hypothetical protein
MDVWETQPMDLIVATLADRFRLVHQVLREEIAGLSPEQLAYFPAPGTNSFGVLVIHLLGSERQMWSLVAGHAADRDRLAEFVPSGATDAELVQRLVAADRLLDELAPRIDAAALAKIWHRPGGDSDTGAYWLINNLGHAREHLAQLQLTKQLFPRVYPPIAHPM